MALVAGVWVETVTEDVLRCMAARRKSEKGEGRHRQKRDTRVARKKVVIVHGSAESAKRQQLI